MEIPTHQATATIPFVPSGVPNSNDRSVSAIGVNGWCSANHASGPGIEAAGTDAELRNRSSVRIMGRLLAVSTLSVTRPRATDSQLTALAVRTSTPSAASHDTG